MAAPAPPCPQAALRAALLARLAVDDLDGAIEAGLMAFVACPPPCCADSAPIVQARQRLQDAWNARERHRARQARLARRAAERDARRPASPSAPAPERTPSPLPAAAAAILARAKARAAGRPPE